MKLFNFLIFCFTLCACHDDTLVLKQKVYFEKHYVNRTWIPQSTGFLIDSTGTVRWFSWLRFHTFGTILIQQVQWVQQIWIRIYLTARPLIPILIPIPWHFISVKYRLLGCCQRLNSHTPTRDGWCRNHYLVSLYFRWKNQPLQTGLTQNNGWYSDIELCTWSRTNIPVDAKNQHDSIIYLPTTP